LRRSHLSQKSASETDAAQPRAPSSITQCPSGEGNRRCPRGDACKTKLSDFKMNLSENNAEHAAARAATRINDND
jgi:hypothetical protein